MAETAIMNETPLVSVITPCYNGERYVSRLFDSILDQTYTNIEFIFVDDGSTDDTEKVFNGYAPRFSEKGIRYGYYKQENKGQAAAMNVGLAVFSGDFLIWPDADDWLAPASIEKRLRFLMDNPDYDLVIGDTTLAYERDGKIEYGDLDPRRINKPDIFMDLLMDRGLPFNDYMIRASAFLESVPSRHIYESRAGQNWQMLLPVAYHRRCGYIAEPLFFRLVHDGSHSRQTRSIQELLELLSQHETLLENVISQMILPDSEKEYLTLAVNHKYLRQTIKLYVETRVVEVYGGMDSLRNAVIDLQNRVDKMETQRRPKSNRAGGAFAYIPRKLRGGYRCLRDNGLSYTVKRVCEKVKNRLK